MTAYVKSGRTAQRRLQSVSQCGHERRLLSNLRGFKQVINTVGVAGIFLTPAIGVIAGSAVVAMFVALAFLSLVCVLEVAERGTKRELLELRELKRPSRPTN